jgi:CBS domain-containing protein
VNAQERVTGLIDDFFARYTYGEYPVERDGETVGIVTLHDLRKIRPSDRSRAALRDS